ncbi:hypothetical protein M406DRAFT_107371 [Cryphonectria parasitica EP155]|uniref:2EXR domain-containing protein n=1 Tax=Cryphonectria parasitica (strain ATCC 38755 / EP155) TaxID=660469 RepID=A0A9P4Y0A0_CRYP1|nr:uncharacterized protein M406DRAFT_107371 [Cryphonectria parasitica EP155]KAF3764186.1 hypothetical protein M406DRAFT_107371 [Cryphonectria parasitica EP155]
MASECSSQTEKDTSVPPKQENTFLLFPFLPKELRLQIWELAIPRERLIQIIVRLHQGERYDLAASEPRYTKKNALGNTISGELYCTTVRSVRLLSKFMRVSKEARAAALSVNRIHIPVYLKGDSFTEKTMLYLNPEHDVLHLRADSPVHKTLLDFLWDLKAYDPKGVGLRKLAVDLGAFCDNDLRLLKEPDLPLFRHRTILRETLAQLEQVWFLHLQCHPTNSLLARAARVLRGSADGNLPLPIAGTTASFERLGAGPGVGEDKALEAVNMGSVDPRELLLRWRRFVRAWVPDYEALKTDYRLFIPAWAFDDDNDEEQRNAPHLWREPVGSRGDLPSWATGKEGGWPRPKKGQAFGFWLFPVEAAGEIGESDDLAAMTTRAGFKVNLSHFPRTLAVFTA